MMTTSPYPAERRHRKRTKLKTKRGRQMMVSRSSERITFPPRKPSTLHSNATWGVYMAYEVLSRGP